MTGTDFCNWKSISLCGCVFENDCGNRKALKEDTKMTNLSHLFNPGQKVRVNFDGTFFKGTVAKTDVDYIIVDIPEISDHCRFESGFNIGNVYPEYNF